jgi:hypothetical protein
MPRSSIHPEQPFILALPQYGPAMVWLSGHGVHPFYIGDLFGIDSNHARVLIHRSIRRKRRTTSQQIESLPFQSAIDWPLTHHERGPARIRPEALNPDDIRARMEEIVARNSREYAFLQGVAELNVLRQYLGDPRNEALLRLLAKLECHRAWFFTHAGLSRSSIEAANRAYLSAVELYRRTRGHDELQVIADAALIASNSHLNRFEPAEARRALGLAAAARERLSEHPNEEYYRQRAVTCLQVGADENARRDFTQALTVLNQQGHNENDASVLLSTQRQANLLPPVNWDGKRGALQVFESASRRFPKHSNEFNIAASWAAACGFSTDSPSANLMAQELIESISPDSARFGHRATVVSLLRLAPRLPQAVRRSFVRFAVHQNAFGDV